MEGNGAGSGPAPISQSLRQVSPGTVINSFTTAQRNGNEPIRYFTGLVDGKNYRNPEEPL